MIRYGHLGDAPMEPGAVALVVQAAYHLDEFLPLRDLLRERGVAAELLVPVPPKKPLGRFRPGVRRFHELLAAAPEPLGVIVDSDGLADRSGAVVVLNDWGVPAALVAAARAAARPTFAWVEGVQDFGDVDTASLRAPYTHVDHVFCLGDYGAEQLGHERVTVVGSERLRRLWQQPDGATPARHAAVNSNFTYGVQTDHRRRWLASVAGACRDAELAWTLSRHVAERGTVVPHRASRRPIGELLEESTHLIGRFSTVCYEALVRGVELVYHNPHAEKEPTFQQPGSGFAVSDSRETLAEHLRRPVRSRAAVRLAAKPFLEHHLRLADGPPPAELAAAVIEASLPG